METADTSAVISDSGLARKNVLFTLGLFGHLYQGDTMHTWQGPDGMALSSRASRFDSGVLTIIAAGLTKERNFGNLRCYDSKG